MKALHAASWLIVIHRLKKKKHLLAVTTDRFHPRVGEGLFNKLSGYVPFPLLSFFLKSSKQPWNIRLESSATLFVSTPNVKKKQIMSTYGIVYKNNWAPINHNLFMIKKHFKFKKKIKEIFRIHPEALRFLLY